MNITKRLINGVLHIDGVIEGKYYFENPILCREEKAKERAKKCYDCPFFKDEPINDFKVIDKYIPNLSGKYCSQCGCISSYKLRVAKFKGKKGCLINERK